VAVLCPVLLAAFPLLSLFGQNQSELELSVLAWPLAICVFATVALFVLLLLLTRRVDQAGVLSSLGAVAFFYFGLFFPQATIWLLVLWLVVFAVAAAAGFRTRRDLGNLTLVVVVVAAVLAVPQAVAVVKYQVDHPSLSATDQRLWPSALPAPAAHVASAQPDIYVIIPDDYARTDILRRYFHYDDSAFLKQLTDRGFLVEAQSRSPYADSESNIASALNMDYLSSFPRVLGKDSEDVRPVKRVMADNRASWLLAAAGYDYVHLDTDDVTFAGNNPGISSLAPPDSFANLWMRQSVLHQVGGPVGFNRSATDARYRRTIDEVFGRLEARRTASAPQFVVFHTLLPHDPYVYAADGSAVNFAGESDESFSSPEGRRAYVEQLRYLQGRLIHAIDQIRNSATTPPVIVIQADEGFQAEPDVFGEKAMNDIRVKGLTALSLPGIEKAGLPDPPNTVNTLRFIVNHYLGTDYPMLPSASYSEGDTPYDFIPLVVK
jgi:hypothetical protein